VSETRVRIAFDLDGTLIPAPGSPMAVERIGLFARAVSRERIRAGTPELLRGLRRRGHAVWLYTTSYRSPARLRLWFASFGVRLSGIVGPQRHRAALTGRDIACSKYPPAFGIDVLVDDAEGVEIEGRRFGFCVLRLDEGDAAWCARVMAAIAAIERGGQPMA
jgi:hypothetical protein